MVFLPYLSHRTINLPPHKFRKGLFAYFYV